MSTDLSADQVPESVAGQERYRGLRGAVIYGLFLLGLSVAVGLAGGALLWLLSGSARVALLPVVRMSVFGIACGVGAGLAQWLCGGSRDRLWSFRFVRGDFGGMTGFLAGVILAGLLPGPAPAPESDQRNPHLVIGQPIEIAGPTLDGGRFDLSEHRGKVVLVDFWATWCGPCVAELPHVREVHEKYRGDGLEIVSISLDTERAELVDFLDSNPMPWHHIFFDEEGARGWDNPLAHRLGVRAIPLLLVVDQQGKLAARNVRGPEIEAAVAEALGVQPERGPWLARVLGSVRRLPQALVFGVMLSPWWMLLSFGVGGAGLGAIVEAAVRRGLGRRG